MILLSFLLSEYAKCLEFEYIKPRNLIMQNTFLWRNRDIIDKNMFFLNIKWIITHYSAKNFQLFW